MKTIIYFFLAVIVFGLVAINFVNQSERTQKILIRSANSNVSNTILTESLNIISKRLKSYNTDKFVITLVPGQNLIQIVLKGNWNLRTTEQLITQKGAIAFYETYSYRELSRLLKDSSHILSILNEKAIDSSMARVGCIDVKDLHKVLERLNSVISNNKCKIACNNLFERSKVCLYALKLNGENGVLLTGADIESFEMVNDNSSLNKCIKFTFKKPAIQLWAEITKRNLNRSIAVVLDNNVLYAPIVRSVIEGGHSQITGDFTLDQLKYIVAIAGNGELPVNFEIMK